MNITPNRFVELVKEYVGNYQEIPDGLKIEGPSNNTITRYSERDKRLTGGGIGFEAASLRIPHFRSEEDRLTMPSDGAVIDPNSEMIRNLDGLIVSVNYILPVEEANFDQICAIERISTGDYSVLGVLAYRLSHRKSSEGNARRDVNREKTTAIVTFDLAKNIVTDVTLDPTGDGVVKSCYFPNLSEIVGQPVETGVKQFIDAIYEH
ncbi:hypothetical protein ACFL0W_03210 [Nanoarchaeota archaeon]